MAKTFNIEDAKRIGETLGVKWDKFSVETFLAGLEVELEHGTVNPATNVTNDDEGITGKIALAHLNESARYYEFLAEMEKKME